MSDFHDPDLRQQLGRLSGPYPDDNVAFEQWQRRVGQARRRRAVAWTAGAALSLIIGTVAVAALQNPAQHSLVPSNSSESSEERTITVPTTENDESSTIESTVPATSAPTTLAPGTIPTSEVEAESSLPGTQGTEPVAPPSNGTSAKRHSTTPTTSATTSVTTSATAEPPPQPVSVLQTFTSDGGSITVRQDGEKLTVVTTTPATGFQIDETVQSGARVEVTFKSGDRRFQITVRLSEGVMKPSTSQRTETLHEESAPADTTRDTRGGDGGDGESGS